jgi:hypothetical protein
MSDDIALLMAALLIAFTVLIMACLLRDVLRWHR